VSLPAQEGLRFHQGVPREWSPLVDVCRDSNGANEAIVECLDVEYSNRLEVSISRIHIIFPIIFNVHGANSPVISFLDILPLQFTDTW